MRPSFQVREESDLKVLLPVRWRNLYPDQVMNPEASREDDLAAGTIHFVATRDREVVGCETLTEERRHARDLRMRWIGVDKEQRDQGIGAVLVHACLEKGIRSGRGIWCNARLPALSLYRRLGFEEVGAPFDIPDIGSHLVMRTP